LVENSIEFKNANKKIRIEFKNVSKWYKSIRALNNISFTINEGEIFGYIGPNGAGKTTTMKIIVGLLQDYQGNVLIDGENIRTNSNTIKKKIGYMPQEVGFQEWRKVYHLLETFGRLNGIPKTILKERIPEVLDLVGLRDVEKRKIIHLSGGMKQKLRMAQSLIHDPDILILDEPLSGLDPLSRFQFKNIIKELRSRGKTILFSSHILSDLEGVADRIGILNFGQIIKIGKPEELQEEFKLGNIIYIKVMQDKQLANKDLILDVFSNSNIAEIIEKIDKLSSAEYELTIKHDADLDDSIYKILKTIMQNNIKLREFRLKMPNLEQVYLHYIKGI